MKTRFLRRALAFGLAVLLLLPALIGCEKEKYPMRSSTAKESMTMLTLGEEAVPFEVLRAFFAAAAHAAPGYGEDYFEGEEGSARFAACLDAALSRIADIYALFAMAKEAGIDPYGKEISQAVRDAVTVAVDGEKDQNGAIIGGFAGDYNAYLEYLRKNFHMNDSVCRLMLRYDEAEKKLIARYRKQKSVTDAELAAFFEGENCLHIEWLHQPAEQGVASRALLETAKEKLIASGIDGSNLPDVNILASYSKDARHRSQKVDNTGFYISPHSLDRKYAAVTQAAFSLPIGGLSEVIEANGGYFLLYRMEKKAGDLSARAEELNSLYLSDRFYADLRIRSAQLLTLADYTDAYRALTAKELLED